MAGRMGDGNRGLRLLCGSQVCGMPDHDLKLGIYGVSLEFFLDKLVFGPVCMHKLGGIGLLDRTSFFE
jgi:hypothetical protein